MLDLPTAIAIAFTVSSVLVALTTKYVLGLLHARQVLDIPNERSSHVHPVPRGGGLGVLAGLLPVLAMIGFVFGDMRPVWFVPGLALLVVISWRDDRASQSAWLRLGCQIFAVALALAGLPGDALVFQGLLPLVADRLLAAFIWLWFINVTNFMDGIDGITGVELISVGLGIAAVTLATALPDAALALYAAGLAGAATGFLIWNWHPAKLFLGDVGSVPLGFLAGGLLILLAAHGAVFAALILPSYYLADATLTLLWRLMRGEPIMRAHRAHWYQHAAARIGHRYTVSAILAANFLLVLFALISLAMPMTALLSAAVIVAILLACLSAAARRVR